MTLSHYKESYHFIDYKSIIVIIGLYTKEGITIRIRKQPSVRKKELATQAMHAFSKKGYERTSIQDIADAAGVAHGLIYKYFKNKQELYEYALQVFIDDVVTQYLELFSKSNFTLENMVSNTFDLLNTDRNKDFFSYLHKKGNETVYRTIMQKILNKMVPSLAKMVEPLGKKEGYQINDIPVFLSFVFGGQIEIMIKTPHEKQLEVKKKILKYIRVLLEASKKNPL